MYGITNTHQSGEIGSGAVGGGGLAWLGESGFSQGKSQCMAVQNWGWREEG